MPRRKGQITNCPFAGEAPPVAGNCPYPEKSNGLVYALGMCQWCYWNTDDRRREWDQKYESSELGKARMERYNESEAGLERKRRWKVARDRILREYRELVEDDIRPALLFLRHEDDPVETNEELAKLSITQVDRVLPYAEIPKKGEVIKIGRMKPLVILSKKQVKDPKLLNATRVLIVVRRAEEEDAES